MSKCSSHVPEQTVGVDLGDEWSHVCVLDRGGEVVERRRVRTRKAAIEQSFSKLSPSRVVMEVGTHSRWVSVVVSGCGHEVVVANARKVKLISEGQAKCDRVDAELLARLGRVDVKLLRPIDHRGERAQTDRASLRSRDALVRARSSLVSSVRGQVKSFGHRLPKCSVEAFASRAGRELPAELAPALDPLLELIDILTSQIRAYDRLIDSISKQRYPITQLLRTMPGIGPLTALAFVLSIEDPSRFTKSRQVGPFVGLVPRRGQSGERDPRLGITKAGDEHLRRLLVQASHYILGPFGIDSELRRFGLRIVDQGGKAAKKRATVAVARKLAVLLHRMWITGESYQPFYQTQRQQVA